MIKKKLEKINMINNIIIIKINKISIIDNLENITCQLETIPKIEENLNNKLIIIYLNIFK